MRNTLKSRTQRSPTRPKQVQTKQEINVPASPKKKKKKILHVSKSYTLLPKHFTPRKQNFQFSHSLDKPNFSWTSFAIFPRKKKKKNQFSDELHFPGKSLTIYNALFCLSLSLSIMAAIASLSFLAVSQCSERKATVPSARTLASNSEAFRFRTNFSCHYVGARSSGSASPMVIHCMSVSTGYFPYTLLGC